MRSYIIPFSGQKIHKIKKKYTQLLKPQRELGEKTHILKVLGFFFYTLGHVAEHFDETAQDNVLVQVFCYFLLCILNCLFRKCDDSNNIFGYNFTKGKNLIKCFDIAMII